MKSAWEEAQHLKSHWNELFNGIFPQVIQSAVWGWTEEVRKRVLMQDLICHCTVHNQHKLHHQLQKTIKKVLKEMPIGTAVPIRIEGGAQELQRLFLQTNLIQNFSEVGIFTILCFFSRPERQILFEKGSAPVLGLVGELFNTNLCEICPRLVKKTRI